MWAATTLVERAPASIALMWAQALANLHAQNIRFGIRYVPLHIAIPIAAI